MNAEQKGTDQDPERNQQSSFWKRQKQHDCPRKEETEEAAQGGKGPQLESKRERAPQDKGHANDATSDAGSSPSRPSPSTVSSTETPGNVVSMSPEEAQFAHGKVGNPLRDGSQDVWGAGSAEDTQVPSQDVWEVKDK